MSIFSLISILLCTLLYNRYTANQAENNEPIKVPLPQQCPPKTIAPTNGSQSIRSTQRSSAVFACSVSTAGIGRGRGRGRSQSGNRLKNVNIKCYCTSVNILYVYMITMDKCYSI